MMVRVFQKFHNHLTTKRKRRSLKNLSWIQVPPIYTSQEYQDATRKILINLKRKRESGVDNSNAGERSAGPVNLADSMLDTILTGGKESLTPETVSGDEAIRYRLQENSKARERRETQAA